MKPLRFGRVLLTALVAFSCGLASFALLFGNPVSHRLIYTAEFGQSPKLLAVWDSLQPAPPLGPAWSDLFTFPSRKLLVLGLLYVWVLGLVRIYPSLAPILPGAAWRRGVGFGLIIWWIAFPLAEFFFPLNLLAEPIPLVAYELFLEVGICMALAVPIAALAPRAS